MFREGDLESLSFKVLTYSKLRPNIPKLSAGPGEPHPDAPKSFVVEYRSLSDVLVPETDEIPVIASCLCGATTSRSQVQLAVLEIGAARSRSKRTAGGRMPSRANSLGRSADLRCVRLNTVPCSQVNLATSLLAKVLPAKPK